MSRARDLADLGGSADAGGLTGRNLIINGAMQVAQRGTSVTGYTDGSGQTYVADRWKIQEYGAPAAQYTITQNDIASENIPFSKSLKFACTATETSSSYLFRTRYDIEGQDCQILQYGTSDAKDVTLSFWVKSNLTGVISGFLYNYANNKIIGWEASITSADTWERKTVTIPPDSNTVFDDNTTGLSMAFTFSSDSSWSSSWSTTSWQTYANTNHTSPSNINLGSSTSNYLELTGIQLEVGDTATPFEHRSYGNELARCQRYYWAAQKLNQVDGNIGGIAMAYGANSVYWPIIFPTTMRTTPSVASGGTWRTRQNNLYTFTAAFGYQQSGISGVILSQGATGNAAASVFWVEPNDGTAFLNFDAEL